MPSVDRLYDLYNVVNDKDGNISKHTAEFKEIISGAKGEPNERRLASQFITRFFQHFPSLQEEAIDGIFDLCEDEDTAIRKQAIKDLPALCKIRPDLIPKVSDILAQLLQMEDPAELSIVQSSLVSVIKIDTKGSLSGLFYQLENNEDDLVCERCVRFLHSKFSTLGKDVFTPEIEEYILAESKKVLQNASEEEFMLMMGILRKLKLCQSLKGHQQLIQIITDQCNLSQPFDSTDLEACSRLTTCLKEAIPLFSTQIKSTQYVDYVCREVVPFLDHIDTAINTNTVVTTSSSLELLKVLAEMMSFSGPLDDLGTKVQNIFFKLLEVMPLPPDLEVAAESLETEPTFEFSRVECLLYIFHQLAKNHSEFLTTNAERLKDFRARLQYFARNSQAYQKKLRESLSDKKGEQLKTEENRIKLIALKTTANISTLIRDLFHQPPSYKATISLSWKGHGKDSGPGAKPEKRHAPITFESPKSAKGDRQIYAPPRDKYSRVAGQYSGPARGRGRGSFRRY